MNKAAGKNTLPIHIAKALIFSYIVTAVILLLLSFILYKVQIPSGVVSVGVILAYILSTFVGGFFIGKKVEARKFLWGACYRSYLLFACYYYLNRHEQSCFWFGGQYSNCTWNVPTWWHVRWDD